MIEILTLLHGLLIGPIEVQLRVPPETASVAVSLDGVPVIEHSGPPWRLEIPFPQVPRPARLGLVAYDGDRQPLAELDRFVNYDLSDCRPPEGRSVDAVTPIVLELPKRAAEPGIADLEGRFRVEGRPLEVLAVEQGAAELLVVQDPAMQEIFDRLSVAFLGHESSQRLGRDEDRDREILLEAIDTLELPVETAAAPLGGLTEAGSASAEGMRNPRKRVKENRLRSGALRSWRQFSDFAVDGRIRYIWPAGPPVARFERETVVFPVIGPFDPGLDGVLWHLQTAAGVEHGQRIADAVAIAGFQATATCRRRAVVVFETIETSDASLLTGEGVRSWLESVQVPLFAMRNRSFNPTRASDKENADRLRIEDPWGESTILLGPALTIRIPETSSIFAGFQQRIEASLKRQRIVWLEGRYLPGEIDFESPAEGYAIAGKSSISTEPAREERGR